MKITFVSACFFCFFTVVSTAQKLERKPFVLGEIIELQSVVLAENRLLNIYLPDGYHPDSAATYPVIYLLDGAADEDFIHIAGLVDFATFPWLGMMPKSIVVGIANVDRKRDFTFPTSIAKDKADYPTTGGSANFIQFLEKELQPFIERKYRTNQTKTLVGQSLGGLLASEVLLKKPALFTHYLIVSPSLWWDQESLLKVQPGFLDPSFKGNLNVFVAVGNEGKVMKRDAKSLAKLLKKHRSQRLKSQFRYFGGQNHANILHLAAYEGLQAVYK